MWELGCAGVLFFFFFFKQKTAYEMHISDWSSDVCSSDLLAGLPRCAFQQAQRGGADGDDPAAGGTGRLHRLDGGGADLAPFGMHPVILDPVDLDRQEGAGADVQGRSEEHTSELQSLMRISYAVFCLKKKNTKQATNNYTC